MEWLFLIFAFIASAEEVLVLTDSSDIKTTHSAYFEALQSRGHKLTIRSFDSQGLRLEKFDEYLYSTIILMCSSAEGKKYLELAAKVSVNEIIKFSDNGGSLIVFGDTDAAAAYRKLVSEFGVEFYEQGTRLYSEKQEKILIASNLTAPSIIPAIKEPIFFSGLGVHYNKNSRLLTPLLGTNNKQIVRNEFKKSEGNEAAVVAVAFQGRNNARAVITGSSDLCANSFTNDIKKGNLKACVELTKWVMNEKGLIRYSGITHYKQGENREKGYLEGEYTLNDDLYYSIDLEELKNGKWQQFKTNKAYLEFVMLEPKIRKYLEFKDGSLVAKFKAPDVHGVYQFKVFLYEPGYSWIETATKVTVRPYKHNQIERFLLCAYPYYASVFASMGGFLVFSFYFLYNKNS